MCQDLSEGKNAVAPLFKENCPVAYFWIIEMFSHSYFTQYEDSTQELFFSRHAQWNAKNNLLCNYCSHTEMSQGSGWIKVEFQWYSALIPQRHMPSSWVSHFQINLSWLLYWQTQRGIWRGKPVTYLPRVKPPLLGCFQVIPDNSCRGWYI